MTRYQARPIDVDKDFDAILLVGYGYRRVIRNFKLCWVQSLRETDVDTTDMTVAELDAAIKEWLT